MALLAATLLAVATPAWAQDAARGAALLAEARAALGGEDKLRAVKTLQARGDFKRMAGRFTEGELDLLIALPDKMRRDEDLSPPGGGPSIVRTDVLNGAEVWDENSDGGQFMMRRGGGPDGRFGGGRDSGLGAGPGPGAGLGGRAPLDPEQMRAMQLRQRQTELARYLLALLLATPDTVTFAGTAESPDGTADVLELKPAEGPVVRLFLDTATHMPLMLTWQGMAPQMIMARRGRGAGDAPPDAAAQPPRSQQTPSPNAPPTPQPATLRMTLGEYKAVSGIKLPHLITRGTNDQTNEEWTIESYRVNPSFKADTFTKKQ